jgi:glycosyltransferase involved in cell wall biosynthesis
VVICTCDRPDTIGRAVRSVLDQEYPDFELLVMDQSRSDATEHAVTEAATGDPRLRYVRLRERGLSLAYNRGTEQARNEVVAYTDDDCVAPAGWLAAVATSFAEHADAVLLYGQVLGPLEGDGSLGDGGEIPTLPIARLERLNRKEGFRVFGMGADFAAKRSTVRRLGGFDEVLGGGGPLQSAQDFDFAFRVYRDGGTILHDPRVIVHHYGYRTDAEWPATVGSYGVGVGGFIFKHVRIGDLYMTRLLAELWLKALPRLAKRALFRQNVRQYWGFLRHLAAGIWRSRAYGVDRRLRLYTRP